MAIAVESSTTAGFTLGSSITIDKPTGLAEGDLMVAVLCLISGTSVANFSTLSGWTEKSDYTGGSGTDSVIGCQVKIADSGDVAASNFTFTPNASGRIAGTILRISGHAPNLYAATTENALGGGATSSPSGTVSLTPTYDNSLVILGFLGSSVDGTGSLSGYSINGTNPSFTEYIDVTVDAGSNDGVFGVAAGIQATSAEITTISATSTVSKNWKTQVTVVYPQANTNISADLLTLTSSVVSPTVTGDANITADLLELTLSLPAPIVTTQTVDWTYESRPVESVWTIEEQ